MNHDHALRTAAVEKYLLNELPQDERDQFEEHFFDCPECALDLRAGAVFLDQAKREFTHSAIAAPSPEKKPRRNLLGWLWRPAIVGPAFAVLLLTWGYQNVVTLPRLARAAAWDHTPHILPTISLVGADSRGGQTPALNSNGKPFLLVFDIPGELPGQTPFANYTCSLYSPSGLFLWQTSVSGQQAKDTVSLRIPPLRAGDGVYTLKIDGRTGAPVHIAQYRFRLH